MITIDWKERLTKDTYDYLENKLPKQDYDFEIIFNWYPERVAGRIPNEVIQFVTQVMASKINRQHEQYIPFFQYLWEKKGEYGKIAFVCLVARFINKKPALYLPILEKLMLKADIHDIGIIFEKVFLPLLKKEADVYLNQIYKWLESPYEPLRKQAASFLCKLLKKRPELVGPILKYLQKRWVYQMTDGIQTHQTILKTIWKIDNTAMLTLCDEYKTTRDPQTVEIICGSLADYYPELETITENWTHSGNARLKKAALSAYKMMLKKKH